MAKEDIQKKDFTKKRPLTKEELQQALVDNFINLQKVLTNMALKFDELSGNISKLLQLFEISAKSFAEKYSSMESVQGKPEIDKEFVKRLDTLLDQNRVISKGIMLIEEKLRERNNPNQQMPQPAPPQFRTPQGYIPRANPQNRQ